MTTLSPCIGKPPDRWFLSTVLEIALCDRSPVEPGQALSPNSRHVQKGFDARLDYMPGDSFALSFILAGFLLLASTMLLVVGPTFRQILR